MNQYEFQITDNQQSNFKEVVKLALDAKLHFQKGGTLQGDFEWYLENNTRKSYFWQKNKVKHSRPFILIGICCINNKPVAVCTTYGCHIAWYTKPKYRQQGIATELFHKLYMKYDLTEKLLNRDSHRAIDRLKEKLNIASSYGELKSKTHHIKNYHPPIKNEIDVSVYL